MNEAFTKLLREWKDRLLKAKQEEFSFMDAEQIAYQDGYESALETCIEELETSQRKDIIK